MEIGLSLGSNLGDRVGQLTQARHEISSLPGTRVTAQSSIYETEPVGVKPEHRHHLFLNAVLVLETEMGLAEAQQSLAQVELKHGRRRELNRFAPRTLDIDILYADKILMETEGLTLPHPRWADRRFVLAPLAEVRPDLVLPGTQRPVRDILATLSTDEFVKQFSRDW